CPWADLPLMGHRLLRCNIKPVYRDFIIRAMPAAAQTCASAMPSKPAVIAAKIPDALHVIDAAMASLSATPGGGIERERHRGKQARRPSPSRVCRLGTSFSS